MSKPSQQPTGNPRRRQPRLEVVEENATRRLRIALVDAVDIASALVGAGLIVAATAALAGVWWAVLLAGIVLALFGLVGA